MNSAAASYPRRLEPDIASRVKEVTLARYRSSAQTFVTFCRSEGLAPASATDFDETLVEMKLGLDMKPAAFEVLVAAVEFFFPRFKGSLIHARMALDGKRRNHTTRHHVPCGRGACSLIGTHFASLGHARLMGGMILQQRRGLRPGEMLGIMPDDVVLPEERLHTDKPYCTVGLGLAVGTKVKRPQFVILREPDDRDVIMFLRLAKTLTPRHMPLVPYSLDRYRRLLYAVTGRLGLSDIGWSSHGPRAGFATEMRAIGVPKAEIMEEGRWRSEQSFRIYVDVVGASDIHVALRTKGLLHAMA